MAKADQQAIVDQANALIADFGPTAKTFIQTLQSLAGITGGNTSSSSSSVSFSTGVDGPLGNFLSVINSVPVRPTDLSITVPEAPTVSISEIGVASLPTVPTFAETPPELVIPSQPAFDILSIPTAPSVGEPAIPEAPTISLPTEPSLTVVDFPSPPTVNIPTFTETFPELPDLTLSAEFSFNDEDPDSPLLDLLRTELSQDITDSGRFGINETDEQALADRLVDREGLSAMSSEEDAFATFAKRGFKFPPGAIAAALDAAAKERAARLNEANREILIQRQDLYRRARENAISQGINVDAQLLSYQNARLERALNANRFAAEFGIQLFDTKVRRYNAQLAGFAAFAQAYETQVRAVLAQTQIFEAEVRAAGLKLEAQNTQVQIFTAQLTAQQTIVNLFTAQLQAARVEAEIENRKIEVFRSEIQAFVAQVEAQNAQMNLYRTAISGEVAKQEAYRAQVDAFRSRVEAVRLQNSIEQTNVQSDIERARLDLSKFEAETAQFRAQLDGEVAQVESLARVFGADIDAYNSIVRAWQALYEFSSRETEAFIRARQSEDQLDIARSQLELSEIIDSAQVRLGAAIAGSNIAGDVLTGATQVMNALVSSEDT